MRWPYIISLLALLGAGLLLFFNILCGASTSSVLGKFYWLEAETSGISGAHPITRWTNYNSCGVSNGRNTDCTGSHAAYPMSPSANFGSSSEIPSGLRSKKGSTYYLSKTGWAFLLLGLLFTLLALLPVVFSFCLPSLSTLAIGSSAATLVALLFTTLAASLLTAAYVKARHAFKSDGKQTSLGKYMFAFIWTSVFLLFLSSLFSGAGCIGSFRGKKNKRYADNYDSSSHETYGNNYMHEKNKEKSSFFSRKKRQNEDLEDVGYAAGLGAAGVGTGVVIGHSRSGGGNTRDVGVTDGTRNPQTGETLDDVAYGAGLGASGATSDYTHQSNTTGSSPGTGVGKATGLGGAAVVGAAVLSHNKSKKNDTIPEADENIDGNYGNATGENLADVGYKAGFGASGATSGKTRDLTGNDSGANTKAAQYDNRDEPNQMYGSGVAGTSAHDDFFDPNNVSSSKPYDTNAATGYSSKTTDPSYGENETTSDSNKGLWGAAVAALGLGGGAVATSQQNNTGKDIDEDGIDSTEPYGANAAAKGHGNPAIDTSGADKYQDQTQYGVDAGVKCTNSTGTATRGPGFFSSEGADVGEGATHAGANAEKIEKKTDQFENKSTALPIGSYHHTKDAYGNESQGYDTGVSSTGANSAAATAAAGAAAAGIGAVGYSSSRKPGANTADDSSESQNRPSKEGAATRPKDTYNNLYVNSKDNDDLTDTTGYEPTNYYKRKTGEDFNTGKETTTESDRVYGSNQGNLAGKTGTAASEANTSAKTAKGGSHGSFLGGERKSNATNSNSELAKRNSTSSSVYDSQVFETSGSNKAGTRGVETGAHGSNRDTSGAYGDKKDTPISGQKYGSNNRQSGNDFGTYGKKTSSSNTNLDALVGAGAVGVGAAATRGAGKTGEKQEIPQVKGLYDMHGDEGNEKLGGLRKDFKTGAYNGSSSTKDFSDTNHKDKITGPNGETLDDVGYSAGLGASGAKTDKFKLGASTLGGSGMKGAEKENRATRNTQDSHGGDNRYGQDYDTTSAKSTSRNKSEVGASAAAALGLGSAIGTTRAVVSSGRDQSDDSKYHGTSGAEENIYSAKDSRGISTDKYSSSNRDTHIGPGIGSGAYIGSKDSATSPGYGKHDRDATHAFAASRNRNPITEGLTSSSGTPAHTTNTVQHSNAVYGGSGSITADKLKSSVSDQDRSYQSGSKAAKVGAADHKLNTRDGFGHTNDTTSGNSKTISGPNYYSSDVGRYEGENHHNDDSIPGTFPNEQVSSPIQKDVGTASDTKYANSTTNSNTANITKSTPKNADQTSQVEYDAQGNPVKKEGILDVILDTAKSVI